MEWKRRIKFQVDPSSGLLLSGQCANSRYSESLRFRCQETRIRENMMQKDEERRGEECTYAMEYSYVLCVRPARESQRRGARRRRPMRQRSASAYRRTAARAAASSGPAVARTLAPRAQLAAESERPHVQYSTTKHPFDDRHDTEQNRYGAHRIASYRI